MHAVGLDEARDPGQEAEIAIDEKLDAENADAERAWPLPDCRRAHRSAGRCVVRVMMRWVTTTTAIMMTIGKRDACEIAGGGLERTEHDARRPPVRQVVDLRCRR